MIDKTSTALDRQLATKAIEQELHPVKEVNIDKEQESLDISIDD